MVQAVEWAWHGVKSCHALDGCLETIQGVLGDQGRDFCTHAAGQVGFVTDHDPTRFFDALEDGLEVNWADGAKVDDFALNARFGGGGGGGFALLHHAAPSN